MIYEFEILYQVKLDIIDGFNWYEAKRLNLGFEFTEEVEKVLNYIKNHPNHYQIKYRNKYREAIVKRFPYVVIYEIIEDTIIVYSVFATKNNPIKKPS